ncbi:sensor histidine kinase [Spirosoma panaciterrae]|uniref:sensor histidine kinase n=1 Tax=Spirosoma panaciterrae TaxID=496058 RepID=UPI00036454BA|nr:ATP-binding protein [Spirosoma panaciterrae]
MTPERWLTRIFEQAPVATALLEGPDYRIKLVNAAMYEIWQLPTDHPSVIGQPVFEAFPNIAGIGLEELLAEVRRTNQPIKGVEAPYTREGQPTSYVNFVYAPIHDEAGNVDVVVVATDVTQQVIAREQLKENQEQYRQLADELTTANQRLIASNEEYAAINEELEEANDLLSRSNANLQTFAYVASHDLQEPLRKIQQFGDLLQTRLAGVIGSEELGYLERMRTGASRMSTLIRDLLTFSRISTQQDKGGAVSLNALLDRVLDVLELVVAELGAQIQIDPLPTILGDAVQLEQLFQNLLSNALKFHRPDVAPQIHIRCQTLTAGQLPAAIKPARRTATYHCIEVTDNGIGFEEKYLDRIFEVFQRLHVRSQYAGTGVGLAICKKVVINHGGVLTARSEPGQGTTFLIYLPVQDAAVTIDEHEVFLSRP